MAGDKTYQEHQASLRNLRSRSLRLTYALQNFSDILKSHRRLINPDKRGGGNQFAGLNYLKGVDLEWLAIQLAQNNYGGKKATSQAFLMAEQACSLLKKIDLEYKEKWHLGRVLLSAFTLAGIYQLKKADNNKDSPYYVIDSLDSIPEKTKPDRTRHEPFPNWVRNWDEFGNRLVKPSYPCPTDLESSPNFNVDTVWLRAVHKLERTAFRINRDVLKWAKNEKVNKKLVPPLPDNYQEDRDKLDKDKKKFERIRNKVAKANTTVDKKAGKHKVTFKRGDTYVQSRTFKSKKEAGKWAKEKKAALNAELPDSEISFYNDWLHKDRVLESKKVRYESKRKQFERHLDYAQELADDGRPFYQRISMDYRGRMYFPPFSYQGSDFCRAVIDFADGAPMTDSGVASLARHTANVMGKSASVEELMHLGNAESNELSVLVHEEYRTTAKVINKFRVSKKPFGLFRAALEWQNWYVWMTFEKKGRNKIPLRDLNSYDEMYKALGFKTVKGKQHLLSYLPIAADHRNSAFQHIGMMQDDDDGRKLVERCRTEDLYQIIAVKSGLPKKDARELVKMIMVPWSYGSKVFSCRDKVLDYRMENAGEISFLEELDYQGVSDLVQKIYDLLNSEFKACKQYQNRITKHVDTIKKDRPKGSDEGIYWRTFSGFWVYQQVFVAETNEGYVWTGERLSQLNATLPKTNKQGKAQLNWAKMKSKTPPNLVHSIDASVVHLALVIDGADGLKFDQLIPIHDSFSVPCDEAHEALSKLQFITNMMYAYPPIDDFISDSSGTPRSDVEPRVNFSLETTYS